jgi:hypothetical protein
VFARKQHGHRDSVAIKAAAISSRKVVMDDRTWRCVRCGCREACNAWVGQVLCVERSFFTDAFWMPELSHHQEAVSGDAQAGVVMEAPASLGLRSARVAVPA